MLLVLALFACDGGAPGSASDVPFDATRSGTSATSVQGALDELYVRCGNTGGDAAIGATPATSNDPAIATLAGRVQELELRVAKLEQTGLYQATEVSYDPRSTTLDARTLQAAVDELAKRVEAAQKVDMGQPGPALFELRDKHGNLVQDKPNGGGGPQGPPGGKGPANGPSGPPNGGAPPPGPPMGGGSKGGK